ncbi:glycosyltransferase family 4 protein [Streptomyces sp. H51]|uniref:glycosyltransferase family 4 protein n=1 Tax=Streptomyces sp. H51 TaxID=3111770 RepID=UPI002D79B3F1|nr:glycosyltransferase family 4 protein [Streptomyces sp. H51]
MRCDIVARALAALGEVDLLVLSNGAYPVPDGTVFSRVQVLPQHTPATSPAGPPGAAAASAAAQVRTVREQVHRDVAPWVRETRYDLVWCARERNWLKFRGLVDAPSVVDVDDLEDVLIRRWLALDRAPDGTALTPSRRADMLRDARWWASVHRRTERTADVLVLASEADRDRTGLSQAVVVPNTYEREHPPAASTAQPSVPAGGPVLLFQGALTWPPNEDAALWLVEEIAPAVRRTHPELRVVLAGSPSARVLELRGRPGVEVVGRVPEMTPYLDAADLVVVPLRVGGGTRIKILEAFAHDVPVVSTAVGAEGIGVDPGVHLEIADTADAIADRCLRLLAEPRRARDMAGRARSFYENGHRAAHARQRIHEAAERALRRAASR